MLAKEASESFSEEQRLARDLTVEKELAMLVRLIIPCWLMCGKMDSS